LGQRLRRDFQEYLLQFSDAPGLVGQLTQAVRRIEIKIDFVRGHG